MHKTRTIVSYHIYAKAQELKSATSLAHLECLAANVGFSVFPSKLS